MRVPTESYEKIFQDYSDALEWMKNIGIKIEPGRTKHYKKVISHWKDSYRGASESEGKSIFPDFVSSMFEVHDFIDIHRAFREVPVSRLQSIIDKLQKGVNGPINAHEETPKSTAARNFLFEATVAARAHRPQSGVEAILNAASDTGIKIDKNKLWIECKRVTSIKKIEENVRKASSQLENIIGKQNGSGHRGIVALDITKILNSGDQIYVSQNDAQLVSSVDRMMDDFIKNHSNVWQELYKRRDRKVVGTLVRFSFMATSESRNLLVHASQWGMNPRIGISRSDENIQRVLASKLKGTT